MSVINLSDVPGFFQRYIERVREPDLIKALEKSQFEVNRLLDRMSEEKGSFAYEEGKWTVKEVLVHMADAERIFVFRALSISRNDKRNLPGFDENAYVPESNAGNRSMSSIRDELNNIRISTLDFFHGLSPEMLDRVGSANNAEISVRALGYVIAGHALHHLAILKERYLIG